MRSNELNTVCWIQLPKKHDVMLQNETNVRCGAKQSNYNPISNFHHYILFSSAALSPITEILGGVDEMSPYEMEQPLNLHASSAFADGVNVNRHDRIFPINVVFICGDLSWYGITTILFAIYVMEIENHGCLQLVYNITLSIKLLNKKRTLLAMLSRLLLATHAPPLHCTDTRGVVPIYRDLSKVIVIINACYTGKKHDTLNR